MVQSGVLRDFLLGAAPLRQLVKVLHLVEALGHALRCEPGFWVVVPAVVDRGTHNLDAL